MTTTNLNELARAARCIDDADWGSARQIDAHNASFAAVRSLLTEAEFEQLESYCIKATSDEVIDEGLRLVLSATGDQT